MTMHEIKGTINIQFFTADKIISECCWVVNHKHNYFRNYRKFLGIFTSSSTVKSVIHPSNDGVLNWEYFPPRL